mmetsp:Transcript_13808/g.15471  ORF Transcript_13808/g.15471 Transcript_13808/m.15471 type:complete len:91 (+) Transcript_13808:306-578(+)
MGTITNPSGGFFSCKGYFVEVRDNTGELSYSLYNDSCCAPFFYIPLPMKGFNEAKFKIKFPENALVEGEIEEMVNMLDLKKVYSDCLGEW